MKDKPLKYVSDIASQAHNDIQKAHKDINPVISVRQGMRDIGIPADIMTIDCLTSKRRILLVLRDENPDVLLYQFLTIDEDMPMKFDQFALSDFSSKTLFDWISAYFKNEKTS